MKIRRVGQIKGPGTVESHGESLFRAFPASVIRAQPDRILSPSPGYTPRGIERGVGRRLPKFISSNSFHVTVKGKSPPRVDTVL